ncbi:hypothetical protein TURU_028487 [Turdus rufiventris]|nr:hypothetical protein TURU_028487 [Turdus rufiventris]
MMTRAMENLSHKERRRGLGLFSLERRRLWGGLIATIQYLMGAYKEDGERLFTKGISCPNIHEVMNPNRHTKVGSRLEKWLTCQFSIYGLNLKYTFIIRTDKNSGIKLNKDSKYLTMRGKSDLQFSCKPSEEGENVYETVNSSMLEAVQSLRILPAKPLQESEYADKRCLRPSGATSPTSKSPPQPLQHSAIRTFDPEERTLPNLQVWGRNLKYLFKHNGILLKPGSTLSVDNLTVKKPPPPTSYAACKNKSKHLLVEQEMQSQPTEKFWWFNTNEYKDQLKRKTDMMKACDLMRA